MEERVEENEEQPTPEAAPSVPLSTLLGDKPHRGKQVPKMQKEPKEAAPQKPVATPTATPPLKRKFVPFEFDKEFNPNIDPRVIAAYVELSDASAEKKASKKLADSIGQLKKFQLIIAGGVLLTLILAFLAMSNAGAANANAVKAIAACA